jgi:hypothetical protein
MAYRLLVAQLAVKDRSGKINQHLQSPQGANHGPIIPWLSEPQAAHMLRCNLAEEPQSKQIPRLISKSIEFEL